MVVIEKVDEKIEVEKNIIRDDNVEMVTVNSIKVYDNI